MSVRFGIHTGEPVLTDDGYVGIDVHRAARICAVAHGGQIVVSEMTRSALQGADADELVDLGLHRLKDLTAPERLFQVGSGRFPPLRSLNATNLPVQPNALIGREADVAHVVDLCRDGVRAVTLTGPGGTGKTRVALQAAAELVPDFPDGVFWVPLAPIRDWRLVIPAAEHELGAKVSLAKHIDERRMLLLFDNFEQVAEAAGELATVLSACPHLKVLVTSRAPLRIAGEREVTVEPLAEIDAVELFRERAVIDEPIAAVREICRRLDGLPLAIELAAARTRLMPPDKLLERLDRRLAALGTGHRDAPERQRTLRATIQWSHDLLTESERLLFARLAVFRGGFTVDAAEQVCDATLDELESLVEKSLLRRSSAGRLGMLETIYEFAAEQLASVADAESYRRRHAEHVVRFAEARGLGEAAGQQGGSVRGVAKEIEAVRSELENVRTALEWSIDADPVLGVRLVIALAQYWVPNAPPEGQRWMQSLLDRNPPLPPALKATALRTLGGLTYIQGDFDGGSRLYEMSLEEFRRLGDEEQVGLTMMRLALEAGRRGDRARATAIAEEARDICRRFGNGQCEAQALYALADVAHAEGRHDEAFEMMAQSANLAAEIGFVWWQVGALSNLAEYALELGRVAEAATYLRECLTLGRSINDRQILVWSMAQASWHAALEGRAREAGLLWGAIEADEGRGRIGQWEEHRDSYIAKLEPVSGDEFAAGVAQGRELSLDDAVSAALDTL